MNESSQEARAAFITGLRDFAEWLESHPDIEAPSYQRFLLPLHTTTATEEFATQHGLTVTYDEDGNSEAPMRFGPITYLAYGYVDFKDHVEKRDEMNARNWAARKGLVIRPTDDVPAEATEGGAR